MPTAGKEGSSLPSLYQALGFRIEPACGLALGKIHSWQNVDEPRAGGQVGQALACPGLPCSHLGQQPTLSQTQFPSSVKWG